MDLSHPAADLLGAGPARILQRLGDVSGGLTGRRIAELAGVPTSTSQRILTELENVGLVEAREAGAARLYTVNRDHVLWDPVQRMFAAPSRIEQIIRESAAEIVGDEASVSLFGSTSRGQAGRTSDVDIVVVWGDEIEQSDRETVLASMGERVSNATGNRAEIIDLTRAQLRDLAEHDDPLIDSWRTEAKTVVGSDLKRLIASVTA